MTLKAIMKQEKPPSSLDTITTSEYLASYQQQNQIPDGHKFVTIFCDNCGHQHHIPLFCQDKLCSFCRKRLYGQTIRRYKEVMQGSKSLRFLTLTIVNHDQLLKSDFDRLRYYWKRLYSLKAIKSRIKGGLYVIEVTNKGNGWHIHMHIIIEGDYIPQSYISNQWHRITGDSRIVYISQVKNHLAVFRYISGYLLKTPLVGDGGKILSAVLRNIRIINSFGTWYRIKRQKGIFKCPHCGNPSWISSYSLEHGLGLSSWMDNDDSHSPPEPKTEPIDLQTWLVYPSKV